MTNAKYKLNTWNPSVIRRNGKLEQVLIFPYKDHGKIKYKIKSRDFQCHGKRTNDSASCNHSDLLKAMFNGEIAEERIDLPKYQTEIKETRQNKYYLRPKDQEAKHFLFYNHETQEFKLVDRKDYETIMGKIDHTHTPTQAEVDRMTGIKTRSQKKILAEINDKK